MTTSAFTVVTVARSPGTSGLHKCTEKTSSVTGRAPAIHAVVSPTAGLDRGEAAKLMPTF